MRPEEIIIRPIITEKSNEDMQLGKYTFEVAKNANKNFNSKCYRKII